MRKQSFDMDTYIKQRLTEITDTDERSFAKEVLLKGLLPVFETINERYQALEARVKREVEMENSRFAVFIMRVRRQDYDSVNGHGFLSVSVMCRKKTSSVFISRHFFASGCKGGNFL